MNITLLTYGTRGDVQPFVALGLGLKSAGWRVRLAAPEMFEGFVSGFGLEFYPLPGDPAELSRKLVDEARMNPARTIQAISGFAMPIAAGVMRAAKEACADADAIVHTFLLALAGHAMARERGIPDFCGVLFPAFAPSGKFASPGMPGLGLGRAGNRFSHWVFDTTFFRFSQLAYIGLRRANPDLPARVDWPFRATRDRAATPVLAAISPAVLPRPADWPPQNRVTGYWFLDADAGWQPPAELLRFLENGPPPVCIGFGSVVTQDMARIDRVVADALAESGGTRAVLLGGWSGIGWQGGESGDIFRLDAAPHGWLFPKMAAIVHHGGAGTTAAALRAGVPALLTPFSSDQPFWADRVRRLGIAPEPIPFRKLTAENLARALREAVSDQGMRDRAAALGRTIRAEDGVGAAVRIIEEDMRSEA